MNDDIASSHSIASQVLEQAEWHTAPAAEAQDPPHALAIAWHALVARMARYVENHLVLPPSEQATSIMVLDALRVHLLEKRCVDGEVTRDDRQRDLIPPRV